MHFLNFLFGLLAGNPDIRKSGHQEVRESGYPEIRISGFPDIRKSGNPDIRKSGYLEFRISGFPELRTCGYLEIRISGFPVIRISAYPDISRTTSRCPFHAMLPHGFRSFCNHVTRHSTRPVSPHAHSGHFWILRWDLGSVGFAIDGEWLWASNGRILSPF